MPPTAFLDILIADRITLSSWSTEIAWFLIISRRVFNPLSGIIKKSKMSSTTNQRINKLQINNTRNFLTFRRHSSKEFFSSSLFCFLLQLFFLWLAFLLFLRSFKKIRRVENFENKERGIRKHRMGPSIGLVLISLFFINEGVCKEIPNAAQTRWIAFQPGTIPEKHSRKKLYYTTLVYRPSVEDTHFTLSHKVLFRMKSRALTTHWTLLRRSRSICRWLQSQSGQLCSGVNTYVVAVSRF